MSQQQSALFAGIHPMMAIGSAALVAAFVLFTLISPQTADALYSSARDFIAAELSWYYIVLMNLYIALALILVFSRYGSIRLGADSDRPEFGYFAWFSMLFGAGIGIGILFWSIAEPIYYLQGNPFITADQVLTPEAAQVAMRVTIFHWGLHGWALYAL